MKQYFPLAKTVILSALLFLFPLFFLTTTQEFFLTNKLYLLAFGGLLLILVSTVELLVTKKIKWNTKPFDNVILLFISGIVLSILISSPNKIQALLNPNFGLVGIVSFALLYFYVSRNVGVLRILSVSSVILSILTIFFFFQPFKNTTLPQHFAFFKNANFTPLGNPLDLAIFLGFFVLLGLTRIIKEQRIHAAKKALILNTVYLTVISLAFLLTAYSLFQSFFGKQPSVFLPPFNISWYAAVETLKNLPTALFGVGIDNFSSMFTRAKDFTYNQTVLWQINSFAISRSLLLHVFTESGILGFIGLGIVLISLFKKIIAEKSSTFPAAVYLLVVMLLFPPSFIVFFLLFVLAALIANPVTPSLNSGHSGYGVKNEKDPHHEHELDLSHVIPLYIGLPVIAFVAIGAVVYFLGFHGYMAEYYFKKSIDGITNKNLKLIYDNQRQAIILNPYTEYYRTNFSQTNFLIANNIASARQNRPAGGEGSQQPQLSDQDKQTISQAIEAAISEAKAAVNLNPQRATNWENLAVIYRNIINVAKDADTWTISSYQRAIVLDPQNPIYRLNLGGVYYSMGNYKDAMSLFEQSVGLKPDWPNAHYNLAWADYQNADYQRAASEMQNILNLLDPKKDKADYEKVQKDLEEFKKKLPKIEEQASPSAQKQPSLSLPTPPANTINPKLKLPKEASPEAR